MEKQIKERKNNELKLLKKSKVEQALDTFDFGEKNIHYDNFGLKKLSSHRIPFSHIQKFSVKNMESLYEGSSLDHRNFIQKNKLQNDIKIIKDANLDY